MFTIFNNYLRLIKITYVLVKHLYYFLPITPNFIKFSKRTPRLGQQLATAFEELGPVFIKFGQSLSARADIVGEDVVEDLTRLRDQLTPFSYEIAKTIIEKEFNKNLEELYSDFTPLAIASASIAQVHQATTMSGQKVAVKVLRPGIELAFMRDIKLFYYLARLINKFYPHFRRLRLREVVDSFAHTVKLEMDLRFEAAAAVELKENLINDQFVYIPSIDWQRTSRKVLTLEWCDAISIYNIEALLEAGHNLQTLAANIAVCFFNQAYRDGFFHADLHHGNILVNAKGQLVLIDFGIMGRLSRKTRIYVAEILKGFLDRDYLHVAHIHVEAGYVPKNQSVETFAQACRSIGEPIVGLAANQISIGKLLAQLFKITEDFEMETQPQLLLLQKTLVVVEGVGSSLDKNVNLWQLAEPWIKEWAVENLGIEARLLRSGQELYEFVTCKLPELFAGNARNIIIENKVNLSYKTFTISIIISALTSLLVIYILKLNLIF